MKKSFALLLPFLIGTAFAQNTPNTQHHSVFHFATEVSREVEKDVMQAVVFSRKKGKSLADIQKAVAKNLNPVIENAKKASDIEIRAEGVRHYADYDNKGKVIGWVAEGNITLKSKNFEAVAAILNDLGEEIAIRDIHFFVSPEKRAALEDEMTAEIIQQFKRKADIIQQGLQAKNYTLSEVHLDTPNGNHYAPRMAMSMMKSANYDAAEAESLPLEAGTDRISARASGKVTFEK